MIIVYNFSIEKRVYLKTNQILKTTMSTLWKTIVMEKKDDYIDLLVKFSHPDAGPFPQDKNFALQLLIHEAYDFDKNYNRVPNGPLGNAISPETFQPFDLEEIVNTYVKDVIIYEAQNLPWNEEEAHAKMDALCEKNGFEKDDEGWDDEWTDHWIAFWKDYTRIPWAIYRVTTTDSKWTDHLKKYQEFDSAAYSEGDDFVSENVKITVPNAGKMSDYVIAKTEASTTESEPEPENEIEDETDVKTELKSIFKKFLGDLWKAITAPDK